MTTTLPAPTPVAGATSELAFLKVRYKLPGEDTSKLITRPVTSADQVGQGRLLPTTSVDELSSTLGLWFGVAPSELPSVAPNIGRFASADIGFMKPAQTAVAASR